MALMITAIVGTKYHGPKAEKALKDLPPCAQLSLMREPSNPFDGNAVAVFTQDGQRLGYIPRADAPAVAKAIDLGLTVTCALRSVGSNAVNVKWNG